jgi:hypothetical protein
VVRPARTVLEAKIRERRMTFEEFAVYVETYAREHGESGTIGLRHLQRLVAGVGHRGVPLGPVRPATARLLEGILGLSMDELLMVPAPAAAQLVARRQPIRIEVDPPSSDDEQESEDPLGPALAWLDERMGWPEGSALRRVAAQAAKVGDGVLARRVAERGKVRRGQAAEALLGYYGRGSELVPYRVRVPYRTVGTGIVTRPEWLDLGVPLNWEFDRVKCADTRAVSVSPLDNTGVRHAVARLAEAMCLDARMTTQPIYRLVEVDPSSSALAGGVAVAPFAEYALTVDLLERELLDALVDRADTKPGGLPLRDWYLPDLAAVGAIEDRLCAGGVLALTAIARPADPYRGPADYVLLVQERSGSVLNGPGRLAVIPKGFHQPLKDVRADALVGATLLREMEEELFGRAEVDSTVRDDRVAAPMHPNRLSAPMRWLTEKPGRLRTECTGFGFNLMSGNYEFASLVVIEDDEFWTRFGGDIVANWEATGLRLYSSLDDELVRDLMVDENWTDEGLFALLQGVRRLSEIGGDRVRLPGVELAL